MERYCSLPTHSTFVCSCARWVESSDSRPQIVLSCCHTQLVFGLSHSHLTVFFSDSTPRMCRLYLRNTHFVFPQHRNAVPDISPVPLQMTTDLMEEAVFGRSVLETVVTNHESADHGLKLLSLLQSLVDVFFVSKFVSHSHRKVALYFPCIQHFCRAWQLTRCLPVLFECITKRDMDRVWKLSSGSFSLFVCVR